MQQLAGILKESVEDSTADFLNQHKEEIFSKFNVEDTYGVSKEDFLNGNFVSSGPFIFHDVEGNDDSSIEFTLKPNGDRNNDIFTQEEVEIGGKKFYLTYVKNY